MKKRFKKIISGFLLSLIFINNIYISNINMIPISILINLVLILILIFYFNEKNIKDLRLNFMLVLLLSGLVVHCLFNSLINNEIYYSYVISMNIILVITLLFYYITMIGNYDIILFICILNINNIITTGLLLNSLLMKNLTNKFNSIFGIISRTDYRINGIVGGTLKAGILSYYIFFLSIYFIKSKNIKILLCSSAILLSFFQSRTAIILIIITFLFFILNELMSKKLKFKCISFIKICILAGILVCLLFLTFNYLNSHYKYLSGTIAWQTEGLLSGLESKSVVSLNYSTKNALNSFYQEASIIEILFGNGQTNWNGPNAIQSDNGYAVILIGFGLIGFIFIAILYVIIFINSLKLSKKINSQYLLIIFNLFLCHLLLNYKSTSLIGFNYFNPFIISYIIIYKRLCYLNSRV